MAIDQDRRKDYLAILRFTESAGYLSSGTICLTGYVSGTTVYPNQRLGRHERSENRQRRIAK